MALDIVSMILANSYTEESLDGAGALKGEKGDDGASVTNMTIDADGNLICTMSDGGSVNAGQIPVVTSEVETLVEEKVTEQIETQLDDTIQEKVDQAIEDALSGGSGEGSDSSVDDEINSWF